MQISERVVMSYKDGPEVQIPKMLIQEDSDGQKWLKVRPSHYAIAKLMLGHLDEFKNCRQPSLAASPQIAQVRKMLLDKITTALGLAGAAESEQDDFFGQGNEGDDADAKAADGLEEDEQRLQNEGSSHIKKRRRPSTWSWVALHALSKLQRQDERVTSS